MIDERNPRFREKTADDERGDNPNQNPSYRGVRKLNLGHRYTWLFLTDQMNPSYQKWRSDTTIVMAHSH